MGRETLRKIVKNELNYYPYKFNKAHYLSETMKENRLRNCKKLLRVAARGRYKTIVFTDEKLFTIEQALNSQNDRQLLPKGSTSRKDRKTVARSHFPMSVMVWAGICASGKTPLIFFWKKESK